MATLFAAQQHWNFGSCGIFGTASARRENASLPLWAPSRRSPQLD